jgi:hypothetical protein
MIKQIPQTVTPTIALICYSDEHNNPCYFEQANIREGKMTAAKPISLDTLTLMGNWSKKEVKDRREKNRNYSDGDMSNVLYCSEERKAIVWTRKGKPTHQYFTKSLKIKDGVYPTPNLVFTVQGSTLTVQAYKTNPKVRYLAPFYNIYSDGVCMGNASFSIQGKSWQQVMEIAERNFFGSKFSHLGDDSSPIVGNLSALYRKMGKEQGRKQFHNQVLIKK